MSSTGRLRPGPASTSAAGSPAERSPGRLRLVGQDPSAQLRHQPTEALPPPAPVAAAIDVTERTPLGIVVDLTEAGYLVEEKDGRRNRYHVEAHLQMRDLLAGNGPSANCSTSTGADHHGGGRSRRG